jgi:hypothetical protein
VEFPSTIEMTGEERLRLENLSLQMQLLHTQLKIVQHDAEREREHVCELRGVPRTSAHAYAYDAQRRCMVRLKDEG